MTSSPYVFISYARADSDAADRIVEGLEQAGIRTWRDISEIKPGTEWAKAIESAAKSASAYVYIASSHSSSSSWMEQELLYALSRTAAGLVIVPAIIDESETRKGTPTYR
ncbi:toll/interleukin-1 receptor domain-containing protein [Marichromatium gracile]|uniref:toll/interleukin-1 receptor domain-containing protein n=1 Tax=Marichromatium gracile TaxID=1048 RepID=UPI00398C7533